MKKNLKLLILSIIIVAPMFPVNAEELDFDSNSIESSQETFDLSTKSEIDKKLCVDSAIFGL